MSQNHSCDSTLLLLRGLDVLEQITDEEYEELGLVHNYVEVSNGEYIFFPSRTATNLLKIVLLNGVILMNRVMKL